MLMDDPKHIHIKNSSQIDVSSITHCLRNGDAKLALQYCHQLLADDPTHVQTLLLATLASRSLGRLCAALDFINRALEFAPNHSTSHSLLGDILLLQERPEAALTALMMARNLGDCSAQNYFNIGSAYLSLDCYQDAISYFNQALVNDPKLVSAHVNKGLAEHSLMHLDAALECFDNALCIDPSNIDAQWNKSHVLLTLGRYEEGLQLYETRWLNPQVKLKKRQLDSQLWLGQESLSGKRLLLFAEGGFGDTIQFIRYAKLFDPDVKLIIECQLPLIELVRGMGLRAEVIAPNDTPPSHDFHCPLMSLPLAFRTTIDTVPQFDRYIYASEEHVKKWGAFMRRITGPKIGIVARGSSKFSNDQNRSFELKALVTQLPQHASYIVLQKELSGGERLFVDSCDNIVAPGEALENFSDTAAICTLLDQVVSVDTGVAHLSAALGRPTTVLLPFRPDWRWGYQQNRTPWYMSAKLVRQKEHGNWRKVLSNWHNDCL